MGENIKNLVVVGNDGSGKTCLIESLLYISKTIKENRKVSGGNSPLDPEPEEKNKNITLSTHIYSCDWKGNRIYLLDTIGFSSLIYETKNIIRYSDNVLFIINAETGVTDISKKLWEFIPGNKPTFIFLNKIDSPNIDFKNAIESIRSKLNIEPNLFYIPMGTGDKLQGVIDVINKRGIIYERGQYGKFNIKDIPKEMWDEVENIRARLIEDVVENDDSIMEKYLEGKELTESEIISTIKKGIAKRKVIPLFCGSGYENIGVHLLLDGIVNYMPSPFEIEEWPVKKVDGGFDIVKPSEDAQFVGIVIKTTVDHFSGKTSFVRVISGRMHGEKNVFIPNKKEKEKLSQIYRPYGIENKLVDSAIAGEVIAIPKTKIISTGDTLTDEGLGIVVPGFDIPSRTLSLAVDYKDKEADKRINPSLQKMMEEDVLLNFFRDTQTNEFIVSGMGDVHLEIIKERLKRKFNVELSYKPPKIPYKETIKKKASAQGKYKKQSGGRGQYGDCWLEIEPLPRGKGYEFVNRIVGGAIPKNFIPAVEKGVVEAMEGGILAGYPIIDVRVTLYDGSFHEVDSSDLAFKIAGSLAFKKCAEQAQLVLLEPIMKVEIAIPDEFLGAITNDLNSRRGKILGIEAQQGIQLVKAEVPLAEMIFYSQQLTSLTQGLGSFSMEFSKYEEVPSHLSSKIIEQSKSNQ